MARRKLVLMVEDEEREREIYGKLLWYNGFDVEFAHDAEQALELARRRRPDVVLLDLMLPGADGFEFCRRYREVDGRGGAPILVLSGRPRTEFAPKARLAGCVDYLEKPVPPLEVLHRIEALVGRPPLPGEIADDAQAPPRSGSGPAGEARDQRSPDARGRIGAPKRAARSPIAARGRHDE